MRIFLFGAAKCAHALFAPCCRWGRRDEGRVREQAQLVTLPLEDFARRQAEASSGQKPKKRPRHRRVNAIHARELEEALKH